MIYEIANAWIDENMNSWDKERFTREDAEYESSYMDSCYHCHNCRRCTRCVGCSYLSNSANCADCYHSA